MSSSLWDSFQSLCQYLGFICMPPGLGRIKRTFFLYLLLEELGRFGNPLQQGLLRHTWRFEGCYARGHQKGVSRQGPHDAPRRVQGARCRGALQRSFRGLRHLVGSRQEGPLRRRKGRWFHHAEPVYVGPRWCGFLVGRLQPLRRLDVVGRPLWRGLRLCKPRTAGYPLCAQAGRHAFHPARTHPRRGSQGLHQARGLLASRKLPGVPWQGLRGGFRTHHLPHLPWLRSGRGRHDGSLYHRDAVPGVPGFGQDHQECLSLMPWYGHATGPLHRGGQGSCRLS